MKIFTHGLIKWGKRPRNS